MGRKPKKVSGGACYAYHLRNATGMSIEAIEYELPYAQGLQLLTIHHYNHGARFQRELNPDETFEAIAS